MRTVLLTLLVPGYRALARGDRGRAMVFQGAFVALFLLACLTPWLASVHGLVSFAALFLVLAVVSARPGPRTGDPVRLGRAAWAWLTLPQLAVALVVAVPTLRRPVIGLDVFRMASHGLEPSIADGERFVAQSGRFDPVRGELVLFRSPGDAGRIFVKRVLAVPGDVVSADPDGLRVNGKLLRAGPSPACEPLAVPAGQVFVVGDDLERSRDSRHFGCIEKAAITGRPLYVLWSRRWSRIGTTLR